MVKGLVYQLGTLGSGDIQDGTIVASEIATDGVTTIKISGLSVTSAKIAAQAVTSAKQAFVGTGSPTGYGLSVQTGSVIASDVEVVGTFGTAYKLAPFVYLTVETSGAAATQPGMVTGTAAGSFTMLGTSGLLHSYMAIGSL